MYASVNVCTAKLLLIILSAFCQVILTKCKYGQLSQSDTTICEGHLP